MTAATGELQAEFEKTSKMNLELTNENERLSTSINEIQGQVCSFLFLFQPLFVTKQSWKEGNYCYSTIGHLYFYHWEMSHAFLTQMVSSFHLQI